MSEMIPCPFCGNDVIGVGYNEHEIGPSKWRAVCYNCGAHGPYCKTNTEAMEAWNHRFADDICVGSKERTAKVECGCKLDWSEK